MVKFLKGIAGFALIIAATALLFDWRAAIFAAGVLLIFDNVT